MTFRSRSMMLAAVGLWMAHPLPGQEPARLPLERESPLEVLMQPSDNQRMADAIAGCVRQCPRLTSCVIHVSVQDGVVELTGAVTDEAQRMEVVRLVQTVAGVTKVQDNLNVSNVLAAQAVQRTPAQPPPVPALPLAFPAPTAPAPVLPPTINGGYGTPFVGGAPMQGHGAPAAPGTPMRAANGQMMMEPQPVYQMPGMSPQDLNPPKMPPHAWPTYAPYNNYSRVGYPQQHPYQAWPFIGPHYPFPKVPLGWRSVKLEWEDGHWWYKKFATQHDWWRIRYW